VCAAGKAAVGDQADRLAEPRPDQGRRRRQHLAHPWAAFRSLVPNHDDVARVNASIQNCGETRFLRIEHPCRARNLMRAVAADFGDGALRSEVAPEDDDVPLRRERLVPRPDDVLITSRTNRHVLDDVGDGAAIDRERVAMQHAIRVQDAHHLRNPAGAMQIGGDIPP